MRVYEREERKVSRERGGGDGGTTENSNMSSYVP